MRPPPTGQIVSLSLPFPLPKREKKKKRGSNTEESYRRQRAQAFFTRLSFAKCSRASRIERERGYTEEGGGGNGVSINETNTFFISREQIRYTGDSIPDGQSCRRCLPARVLELGDFFPVYLDQPFPTSPYKSLLESISCKQASKVYSAVV